MLELRAQLEMDPSSSHRGGAEALRAKLQLVEDRVYQAADGVVADAVLQQWLNDFDKQKGRALMNTTAKQAANAEAGSAPRWKPRDDVKKTNKKYDNKHNDKKPTGGKGKAAAVVGRGEAQTAGERCMGESNEKISRVSRVPDSFEDGLMQRERVRRVLNRLGLLRNEKKGQCDPVQVIEHLGLEVDLKHAKVDLEWWSRLPAMSKWNGRKIWRSPTRVKLHTDSSMMAWGGVLNLEHAARGFWWDEMREWHITHLELEAVFKTVQAFLRELEGKVVAHKLREEEAAATVAAPYWPGQSWFRELEALATEVNFNDDGTAHVVYDDGDEETLNLSEEKFNILLCEGVNEQNKERGGDYKENKRGGETQNFFIRALCERWRSELGQSDYTDLAILMQRWSLLDSTLGNYGPKAERFVIFCVQRQRQWLPVTEATVLLYVASLLD
ncbi:hypothetical protein CYMTET_54774 [Cymbomonas tetramitiformis]|uniref:Uncharacterized protein n=1 Tax=Cymbomonas tetramitiformis TaxID=36881 RepID=A0AAE0ENE5_9CHLO|nr:hypothetical protein CYMTET_54774 [Cymbomonas tetramitiformis]